jgi:hypothetical protein
MMEITTLAMNYHDVIRYIIVSAALLGFAGIATRAILCKEQDIPLFQQGGFQPPKSAVSGENGNADLDTPPKATVATKEAARYGPREQILRMLETLRADPWNMRDTGPDSLVGILIRAYQCVDTDNSRIFQRLEAMERQNKQMRRVIKLAHGGDCQCEVCE